MIRNYQKEAKTTIFNLFQRINDVTLCMPTGSGKTFTFVEVAKEYHSATGQRILIAVHRVELLLQAKKALGELCFIIDAKNKHVSHDYFYYVGMVESIHNRARLLPDFGLCIYDEAHIKNFTKLGINTSHTLRATATPLTTPPMGTRSQDIVIPISISQLIQDGYLCNARSFGFKEDEFALAVKSWEKKAGEYTDKDQLQFFGNQKMVRGVLDAYNKKSAGLKTLVFNVNKEHCILVNNAFLAEGINSRIITSDTDADERKETLDWFRNTPNAVLQSVGVLTTGFDEPSIRAIILNRATTSLNLYLQMIGRGSRIFEDKEYFILIDLGKNVIRHNFYDHEHDWRDYFFNGRKKKKKAEGSAPTVKSCPKCEALIPVAARKCEFCGYERPRTKQEEKEFELSEYVRNNLPAPEVLAILKEVRDKNLSPFAALYRIGTKLLKEQKESNGKITDTDVTTNMYNHLELWCKFYGKKNNYWLKKYAISNVLGSLRLAVKKSIEMKAKPAPDVMPKLDIGIKDLFSICR